MDGQAKESPHVHTHVINICSAAKAKFRQTPLGAQRELI